MKYTIFLFFIFSGYFSFAQVPLQTITFSKQNTRFNANNFNAANYATSLKLKNRFDRYSLTIHNPMMNLNDNYTYISGNYRYKNSTIALPTDNFQRGIKIDSFNPNGAYNLESSVITGLFNLVFDKSIKLY